VAPLLATVVDVESLWRTAWTAAGAGIGVCLVFAFTVLGATRSSDMRRESRAVPAALFGLLAVVGVAGTLAIVAYGVILITTK
jgi:hypothetical protein